MWITACRRGSSSVVVAVLLCGLSSAASGQLVRVGTEFQVSQFTGSLFEPAVAMDASGDFVVVWSGIGQDGESYGVFARRFDPSGNALGAEFQVNTHTPSQQRSPDVATEPNGDFVVVWESVLQDGQLFGVFGQRFDSAGTKVGGEFRANSFTLGSQSGPRVAVADDGDFVVVWYSDGQDGSENGVFGRRFDSAGAPQDVEFQINGFIAGTQWFPALAMDSTGNFVVAWDEEDRGEVLGRRYDADGLLIIRYLFGLRDGALISGAVAGNCTRCTADDIEAFIASVLP